MGGTSSSQQTQNSTTAPWLAAQPALNGILSQLKTLIPNSGLNSTEQGAINQLTGNAAGGNPYAPAVGNVATSLLNGGGATAQAPNVNSYYQQYYNATNPLASNTNYNPYSTPGFGDALGTLSSDITQQINGQFAAAGRSGSGANTQALARGLMQGEAPIVQFQYNSNVANQQGAANGLLNAGYGSASLLSGLQQQGLTNEVQGVQTANDALAAKNYGPSQILALQQLAQSIPAQNLGLLAQIGIPIGGLGGQSTGQSNTTNQASGAQTFALDALGLGNILKLLPSDRRLKMEIEQVGTLFDGQPVYGYRYRNSHLYTIGLIAQEVEKTLPEAVSMMDNGFAAVDYEKATARSRAMKVAA